MPGIKYYVADVEGNITIKTCDNSIHSCKRHFHEEISMAVIESGNSDVEVEMDHYRITDRTLLIIPQDYVHSCHPQDYNQWKFRMLYIDQSWFDAAFTMEEALSFSYMKLSHKEYMQLFYFFLNIEKGAFDIEKESELINWIARLQKDSNYCKTLLYEKNIERVKQFIEDNYRKDTSLKDLEHVSNMSKYSIIRQFTAHYGMAPHQYITNCRINLSKTFLKQRKNFSDIAFESGFYDQSHFIRSFKSYTGVTPKQYQQQI